MFKYRDHRGSLADSLETMQYFSSVVELVAHIQKNLPQVKAGAIHFEKYGFDSRINWDTYCVRAVGYGVIGFTDRDPTTPKPKRVQLEIVRRGVEVRATVNGFHNTAYSANPAPSDPAAIVFLAMCDEIDRLRRLNGETPC